MATIIGTRGQENDEGKYERFVVMADGKEHPVSGAMYHKAVELLSHPVELRLSKSGKVTAIRAV